MHRPLELTVCQGPTGVGRPLLEPIEIELIRFDLEHVSRRPGDDPRGAESIAQLRYPDVNTRTSTALQLRSPNRVEQPFDRDDLVRVEQQVREQGTLARPPERQYP